MRWQTSPPQCDCRPIAKSGVEKLALARLHYVVAWEGVAPKKLALEVLTEHRRALGATTPIAPTNDEAAMLRAASALWGGLASTTQSEPRRFTVTALELVPWPSRQVEIFNHEPTEVQVLIDTVRGRFGARAIALGDSIDRSGRYTGVKIAFEHIPAVAEFEWLGIEVPEVAEVP